MTKLDEFRNLNSDEECWQWIIQNRNRVVVHLNNDETFITVDGEEGSSDFFSYVGWSDGVFSLLSAIGVRAESV